MLLERARQREGAPDVVVDYQHPLAREQPGRGRILVPYPADWRWRAGGQESPWFPGFPTYREDADGDWSAALARLAHDLKPGGNP